MENFHGAVIKSHESKAFVEKSTSFIRLLHQHRFVLVRIWDEIHQPHANLSQLIEGLRHRFRLQEESCDYCPRSTAPLKHYAAAIVLCKLAGIRCQNLEFSPASGGEHVGYKLLGWETPIQELHQLKTFLTYYNDPLIKILKKDYDLARQQTNAQAKKTSTSS